MAEVEFKNIALLIDADNASHTGIDPVLTVPEKQIHDSMLSAQFERLPGLNRSPGVRSARVP